MSWLTDEQLLAVYKLKDELKAKDTEIKRLQEMWDYQVELIAQRDTELAAKDARIAVVEGERDRQYQFNAGQIVKVAELEAKLAAVSEVLKEKPAVHHVEKVFKTDSYRDDGYRCGMVAESTLDEWVARLRSIVEDKQ